MDDEEKDIIHRMRSIEDHERADRHDEIGDMLYDEKDYEGAIESYTLSAKLGNMYSQCRLGAMYDEGIGVKQCPVRAYMWYEAAELSGHEQADKFKAEVAAKMTPEQIEQARKLALEYC